jgi:hypothetical protein
MLINLFTKATQKNRELCADCKKCKCTLSDGMPHQKVTIQNYFIGKNMAKILFFSKVFYIFEKS